MRWTTQQRIEAAAETRRGGRGDRRAAAERYDTMLGAGSSKGHELSRAASGRRSRSAAPSCAMPRCWCWTSRRRRWMREREYEIFQRFRELTEGKIAILISHRFSTVRMADRIVGDRGRPDQRVGHARRTAGTGWHLCAAVQHAGRGVSLTEKVRRGESVKM